MPDDSVFLKESSAVPISDLPHQRDENFVHLYANSAGVAANFYDVTIIFGEINLQATKGQSHVKDKVSISMSWEHAKALLPVLQTVIAEYEATNGQIRVAQ